MIKLLEQDNSALKLTLEEKDEKITELEKWVNVLSDIQSSPESENAMESIK